MKKSVYPKLLGLIAIVLLAVSCSKSSFDYLGKSYAPTQNPEIFFRTEDVPKDYEVMGKVTAEVPYHKKLKYLQAKVEKVAREHGADAILFSDVNIRSTGYTRAGGGASAGRKVRVGGNVSKTSDDEVKSIEATLIKYK